MCLQSKFEARCYQVGPNIIVETRRRLSKVSTKSKMEFKMAFDKVVIVSPLAECWHDLCIEESTRTCHLSLVLNMTFGTTVRSRETSRNICISGLKFDFTAVYIYILRY